MKGIFKFKRFLRMFIANTISRFGDSVDMIAFGYLVYALTGSKVLLATIYVFNVLPNILFSTFSGTVVDFFSKKAIILIGDTLRGSMVLIAAILYGIDALETWHLFVLTFMNSTIETFVSPCKFATIPKLVDEEYYLQLNSTVQSATKFVEMLGIAVAGFIIGTIGISGALAVDAITFFMSAILISTVRFPKEEKKQFTKSNYSKAYKEGIMYVWNTKVLLAFIVTMAMLNFLLTPLNAFMPAYVDEILEMGPEGISYLSFAFAAGSVVGGILAGQIGKKLGIKGLVFIGLFFAGAFYGAMGLPLMFKSLNNIWIISSFAAMVGLMVPFAVAGLSTFLMTITPKDMLARLGSVINMFSQIATPMGAFVSGAMILFMPLTTLMMISGVLFMLVAFMPIFALKRYEKSEKELKSVS